MKTLAFLNWIHLIIDLGKQGVRDEQGILEGRREGDRGKKGPKKAGKSEKSGENANERQQEGLLGKSLMMPSGLTTQQQRFVDEYMTDYRPTEAAIRAGYEPKSAHTIARALLMLDATHLEIRRQQTARATGIGVDSAWVVEKLIENHARAMQQEPVRDKNGRETGEYKYDGAVANKALELIGKHIGMFNDKLVLELSKMSDTELIAEARRIYDAKLEKAPERRLLDARIADRDSTGDE